MRASEAQMIAQKMHEQHAILDLGLNGCAIHRERQRRHDSSPSVRGDD
jgi:hypothetical protein